MLVKKTKLTPALQAWLIQASDPGRFLYAEEIGEDVEISVRLRMGASLPISLSRFLAVPMSESEIRHVTALLAAAAVETLRMPEANAAIDFAMFSGIPEPVPLEDHQVGSGMTDEGVLVEYGEHLGLPKP